MKIILSRKGFDSGYGGVASPIFPDGSIISFPIPGYSETTYEDISLNNQSLSKPLKDLTKQKIKGRNFAHLDPDIYADSLNRKEGWLPSLGQTGSAQGHLDAQEVSEGDIFLFFGWFRQVEEILVNNEPVWRYVPNAPNIHVLFGYLQIGNTLHIGEVPDAKNILKERPWLEGHPHLIGNRDKNNSIHIGSEKLKLFGKDTNLPGGAGFTQFTEDLVLTAPNQTSRTLWKAPSWLLPPTESDSLLSYHKDINRWTKHEDGYNLLQSVAKGQEFVIDCKDKSEVQDWLQNLITNHLTINNSNRKKLKI